MALAAVDGQMNVNTEGALQLRFSGVPAQHVAEIRPKLLALLGDHGKGDAIDMARIDLTIQRQILRVRPPTPRPLPTTLRSLPLSRPSAHSPPWPPALSIGPCLDS